MSEKEFECVICNKPIESGGLAALGKYWHKEHFQCVHCHQEIGTEKFVGHDGVPYCKPDYDKLFSKKCGQCDAVIKGGVEALGKFWHKEHFTCDHCHEELCTKKFIQHDGKPYCEKDYDMLFPSRKCAYCNKTITANCVTAFGKTYHPEHFLCAHCKKPVQKNLFKEKNGKPYCEDDYSTLFPMQCAGCNIPLGEDYVTDGDKLWHQNCFSTKDLGACTKLRN